VHRGKSTEDTEKKEKDLTQSAQREEHRGRREEGKGFNAEAQRARRELEEKGEQKLKAALQRQAVCRKQFAAGSRRTPRVTVKSRPYN